jgi:UMF1 family MFS transporter
MNATNSAGVADAPPVTTRAPGRERWSWALYDFANTIFSMNVATLYFAVWMVADLHASNTAVAIGNGIASILVMLSVPLFGAISDATRRRKPWVVGFTLLAVCATIAIGAVGERMVPLVGEAILHPAAITNYHIGGTALIAIIVAFIVANYAYQSALPFYNAMMPELAPPHELGRLSGLGTAVGYIGSIAGVFMITPFFNGEFPVLGAIPEHVLDTLRSVFPFSGNGGRVSTFAPTAIMYLLFSVPLILWCKDHFPSKTRQTIPWKQAFKDVHGTLQEARQYPGALRFIIASFLYQDAMGTIISYMALYAVVAMGFKSGSETTLFVVLTIPAALGSWLWGKLSDQIGPKRTLMGILVAWMVLLVAMMLVKTQSAFWVVGGFIGFIYGGLSVAERPMLLSLIPDRAAGRFFGLMVLSARAAAILGPFVWAGAVDNLSPSFGTGFAYRAAVGTVAVAMVIAFFVLRGVPDRFRQEIA